MKAVFALILLAGLVFVGCAQNSTNQQQGLPLTLPPEFQQSNFAQAADGVSASYNYLPSKMELVTVSYAGWIDLGYATNMTSIPTLQAFFAQASSGPDVANVSKITYTTKTIGKNKVNMVDATATMKGPIGGTMERSMRIYWVAKNEKLLYLVLNSDKIDDKTPNYIPIMAPSVENAIANSNI